jgi:plasmid stabilization system protein ParE
LRVLERSPWIGRPSGLFREIVIGEDATASVARYRVDEAARVVEILALRHAREDGYKR